MLQIRLSIAASIGAGFLAGFSLDNTSNIRDSIISKISRSVLYAYEYVSKKSLENRLNLLAVGCVATLTITPFFALSQITHGLSIILLKTSILYGGGILIGNKVQRNPLVESICQIWKAFLPIIRQGGAVTAASLKVITDFITHPIETSRNTLRNIKDELSSAAELLKKASQVDFSEEFLSENTQQILKNAAEIHQYLTEYQEARQHLSEKIKENDQRIIQLEFDFNQKVEAEGLNQDNEVICDLRKQIETAKLESKKYSQALTVLDQTAQGLETAADALLRWHVFVLHETDLSIKERAIGGFFDQRLSLRFLEDLFGIIREDESDQEAIHSLKRVYNDVTRLTAMKRQRFSEDHKPAEEHLKTLTQESQVLAKAKIITLLENLENSEALSLDATSFSESDLESLQKISTLYRNLIYYFQSNGLDPSEQEWSKTKQLFSNVLLGGALLVDFGVNTLKETVSEFSSQLQTSLHKIIEETNLMIFNWGGDSANKLEMMAITGIAHISETHELSKEIRSREGAIQAQREKYTQEFSEIERISDQLSELETSSSEENYDGLRDGLRQSIEELEEQEKRLKSMATSYKRISFFDKIRFFEVDGLAKLATSVELPLLKQFITSFSTGEEGRQPPEIPLQLESFSHQAQQMIKRYHDIAHSEDCLEKLRQTELEKEPDFDAIETELKVLAELRKKEIQMIKDPKKASDLTRGFIALRFIMTIIKIDKLNKALTTSVKRKYKDKMQRIYYMSRNTTVSGVKGLVTTFFSSIAALAEADSFRRDNDSLISVSDPMGLLID